MQKQNLCRYVLSSLLGACLLTGGTLAAEAADPGLHVDQVGYLTGHEKVAMVTAKGEKTFSLVDARTGKVVYEGKLSAPAKDAMSEENLQRADFTAFKKPGTYRLQVGSRSSYDFVIGDNVYAVPAAQAWRSYTLARCNQPIDDKITGLKIKGGHPQDAHAEVYFSDDLNKKGDKLDMTGGWYDAGDYGKYTTTGAQAAAELLLAYEAHPDHFTRGQLQFPQGVTSDSKLPDVLTEVRYELDWLQKMQRADGSTFHKVAGAQWPGFDKTPDTDTQPRFIYGSCSSATAMYGAAFAIGARVYKVSDPDYASALLSRAETVWQYLQNTPKPVYRQDKGQESGSGPYNKATDAEERVWMAAEMFRTTGDKAYEAYLLGAGRDVVTRAPSFFTWDNMLAVGQFSYLKAAGADRGLQAQVRKAFLGYADQIVSRVREDGLQCALLPNEYTWASTKNALTKGDILLMANQIAPKQAYVEGALSQIHYLFGRNSLDKSFMTGAGDNPPMHPHNRIHASTGVYVPGLIVGGPNHVSGGDPDQTKYLASGHIPVAKSYLDVQTSWSTNEYAIDYIAAGVYALSWFSRPSLTP